MAILAGMTAGIVLGWLLNPPDAKKSTLEALRSDYQADYVLMVAEKFAVDQNVLDATTLLSHLTPSDPLISINQAQIMGQQLDYSEREMQLISDLEIKLALSANAPFEVTP